MKKFIITLVAALGFVAGAQASESVAWDKAPVSVNDLPALQNGAKLFVNYCLNCHSASYVRFNRLKDLGLSEQQIKDNLLFTTDKVGETMTSAINAKDAKLWFGAAPPDLSLIARSRAGHGGTGADYLYTYLRSYYRDPSKATGWDNLVFPSVAMPHVLWELQGERQPEFENVAEHGHEVKVFKGWKQVSAGTMTPREFDQAVGDLVGFLQWMGEPGQRSRVRIGVWVLLFLGLTSVMVWRLNAAYWKDVH